jgi:hypothetical protein
MQRNGELVSELAKLATYDASSIEYAPRHLRKVLEAGAWRRFACPQTWEEYEYGEADFEKFVRARYPAGLTVDDGVAGLIRICEATKSEDAEVCLRLIRGLIPAEAPHGGKREKQVDTVNLPKGGNSETYLLRRLKRDQPELAARVVAGEISAHRAAIEAGICERTVQVPPTVEGFIRAIEKHLTAEQKSMLMKGIESGSYA